MVVAAKVLKFGACGGHLNVFVWWLFAHWTPAWQWFAIRWLMCNSSPRFKFAFNIFFLFQAFARLDCVCCRCLKEHQALMPRRRLANSPVISCAPQCRRTCWVKWTHRLRSARGHFAFVILEIAPEALPFSSKRWLKNWRASSSHCESFLVFSKMYQNNITMNFWSLFYCRTNKAFWQPELLGGSYEGRPLCYTVLKYKPSEFCVIIRDTSVSVKTPVKLMASHHFQQWLHRFATVCRLYRETTTALQVNENWFLNCLLRCNINPSYHRHHH